MRPKLLQSFIVVVVFWMLATTLWWSLQQPAVNLAALAKLKQLLPFIPVDVPQEASILSSINVQGNVLMYWSFPMLLGCAVSGLLGYGAVWLRARGTRQERTQRETGHGNYRGATLTVGVLPEPLTFPRDEISLGAEDGDALSQLTSDELRLLSDVIGTVSAHPKAYAGDGVQGSLLDHTLKVATEALTALRYPGLFTLVAASHELGKITAYQPDKTGGFTLVKNQDNEAAKILRTLESWFALPEQTRNAVMLAVKFRGRPLDLPEVDSDAEAYALACELVRPPELAPAPAPVYDEPVYETPVYEQPAPIYQEPEPPAPAPVRAAPYAPPVVPARTVAPAPVAQPVAVPAPAPAPAPAPVPVASPASAPAPRMAPAPVAAGFAPRVPPASPAPRPLAPEVRRNAGESLSDVVFNAFIRSLPSLPFQNRGLPKGVSAVAWKAGQRAFLIEIKLRDTVMAKLPDDVRMALQPDPKVRTRLQPFTMELMAALHSRGWLVTQIGDTKLPPKDAVWNVKAGKLDFRGVLVVDVPEEYRTQLPPDDSMYEVAVTGPLFTSAVASTGMSKEDLLGSVLRPAPRV